jgi:cytochrome c-type biogenesis protein CcmE
MRVSTIITGVIALGALSAVVMSFSNGASPYITLKEAKTTSGDRLHLAGDLVKGSVKSNIRDHTVELKIKDANGDVATVLHSGDQVNLQDATRVVAVGKLEGDVFKSEQLLVKCPSKYEGEEAKPAAKRS